MGDAEFLSDVWRSPLDPNWGKEPWNKQKGGGKYIPTSYKYRVMGPL